jgi:hypothetical protein
MMNDNDELESIWKDVHLIEMGHYLSSFLEETEENMYQPESPEYYCTELN